MSVVLAVTAGSLFAVGTYLLLQRRLSRIIVGLGLLSHGANVLLVISAGERGGPAFIGRGGHAADPLPQAMALTAIVITFGVTGFLLALAYRSWQLSGDDEVEDDVEDRLVARRGHHDEEVSDEQAAAAAREAEEATREGIAS